MGNRVSQVVVEAVHQPDPTARVSQVAVEALSRPVPSARVSQVVVEVLRPNRKVGNAQSYVVFAGL